MLSIKWLIFKFRVKLKIYIYNTFFCKLYLDRRYFAEKVVSFPAEVPISFQLLTRMVLAGPIQDNVNEKK